MDALPLPPRALRLSSVSSVHISFVPFFPGRSLTHFLHVAQEGTFTQYRRWFRSNLGPTQVWAPPTPDASGQGAERADAPMGSRGSKRAGTGEQASPGDQVGKKRRWQSA